MKKETILIAVVALVVGLLGGFLIFSLSNEGKTRQTDQPIPGGSAAPVDHIQRIAETEKIVATDPKNLKAWISLGNDYFDTQQPQKAIHAYAMALEIQPDNPDVLTDQGIMFRKVGWYDKALGNFEKAQKVAPSHLQSLYNIGVVFAVDLKQPERAIPFWTRYLKQDSTSETALQIKRTLDSLQQGVPQATKH
ncbi:MAG: tetratricopeptide repeat protein [Desulfuromonadales bacterium]|nr:tetratricopeptide repeat protein [Desulfuromonadales bacterium]